VFEEDNIIVVYMIMVMLFYFFKDIALSTLL